MELPDRPFRNWKFDDQYTISFEKHMLWVSNGFPYFEDYRNYTPLLKGLTVWERWRLWREYKKELRLRCLEALKDATR